VRTSLNREVEDQTAGINFTCFLTDVTGKDFAGSAFCECARLYGFETLALRGLTEKGLTQSFRAKTEVAGFIRA